LHSLEKLIAHTDGIDTSCTPTKSTVGFFTRLSGDGVTIGPDELRGLFQP